MNGTKEITYEEAKDAVEKRQLAALHKANAILKKTWYSNDVRISFNLSNQRSNLNYNIESGKDIDEMPAISNRDKEINLVDARKVVEYHQIPALKRANDILKEAWPQDNLQISLNLSKDRHNLNYNIKRSGMER